MAAIPEAPAEKHEDALAGVMPPMARTGIDTDSQT